MFVHVVLITRVNLTYILDFERILAADFIGKKT